MPDRGENTENLWLNCWKICLTLGSLCFRSILTSSLRWTACPLWAQPKLQVFPQWSHHRAQTSPLRPIAQGKWKHGSPVWWPSSVCWSAAPSLDSSSTAKTRKARRSDLEWRWRAQHFEMFQTVLRNPKSQKTTTTTTLFKVTLGGVFA